MLYWAFVFLILALVAGLFGFGLVLSTAVGFVQILFVGFLVLFVLAWLRGRRGSPL